jgi:hypothetical protein
MKKTLTTVVLDALLALYLNGVERADYVLRINLPNVSIKNRKAIEQILARDINQKISYWHALADELEHQAVLEELSTKTLAPSPLANALRQITTV